jgi:hypothetical protein
LALRRNRVEIGYRALRWAVAGGLSQGRLGGGGAEEGADELDGDGQTPEVVQVRGVFFLLRQCRARH